MWDNGCCVSKVIGEKTPQHHIKPDMVAHTYTLSTWRGRQEGQKFKVVLSYIGSLRLAWASLGSMTPCLKTYKVIRD